MGELRKLRHLTAVPEGVLVCLDSTEENMVPALALRAAYLRGGSWNGWARPVATAQALSDFLGRWRINDPHGTWGTVVEIGGTLICRDSEGSDPDEFPQVSTAPSGEALYDLSGWVWTLI